MIIDTLSHGRESVHRTWPIIKADDVTLTICFAENSQIFANKNFYEHTFWRETVASLVLHSFQTFMAYFQPKRSISVSIKKQEQRSSQIIKCVLVVSP